MPSNLAHFMGLVAMPCGHTNTYGKPWPLKGELAWCVRCRRFRRVLSVIRLQAPERDRTTTYSKSVRLTHYTDTSNPFPL